RDGVTVKASLEPPPADERCEPCCEGCPDCCLLLARIDNFEPGKTLAAGDIDNSIRRLIGLRTPTRITGISWTTGATYTKDATDRIRGVGHHDRGLVIQFSRPIKVATLIRGVIDLWVVRGGRGVNGPIENWDGEFVGLPQVKTGAETIDRIKFRSRADEEMQ